MKLEQLKQEITQLSALVEGWQESGYAVEIERDLALEKVRNIYNTLRFKMETEPIYPHAESGAAIVAAAATTMDEKAGEQSIEPLSETEQEPDFEIEFIIPEEEDSEESEFLVTDEDDEEESDNEYTDEDEDDEEGDYNDGDEEEDEEDFEFEPQPASEPEAAVEPKPTPEPKPEPDPEPTPQPAKQPQFGLEQSLFGAESAPRTAPRRRSLLMSLYNDTPQVENNHSDNLPPKAATTSAKGLAESHTTPHTAHSATPSATTSKAAEAHDVAPRTFIHVQEPSVVTLADTDVEAVLGEVLIPERQTLGDTISPMQTVAESAPVKSLRSSISVADRFMLSRSLFGGDDTAFDRAIEELDSFDDFDNCIIHITENYSWPPASEGAKMIIELLQRKFL